MTAPLDLEGIKERLEAATPGPWRYVGNTVYIDPMSTNSSRQSRYWALPGDCETAALIANAPADLAALVAEVERLTSERDEARTIAAKWFGSGTHHNNRWCDRTIDLWYAHRKAIESWPVQEARP